MNADQVFNPEFLASLSGAVDRYYNSESGSFTQGYEHFRLPAGQATIVKAAAKALGLNSVTYGTHELPDGTPHPEGPGAGYDWEVVDNRWLVDLWLLSYYGKGPVLYDLSDPKQFALAERTFGHRDNWEKEGVDGLEMETATKIWNNFILPHQAVDDLLSRED